MTSLTRFVNTTAHTSGDGTTNGTGNGGTNSFVSLNAALTALAQDLTVITPTINDEDGNATVALDVICSGSTADTTAISITSGWTTNPTHRLRVRGANPSGALWNTSNYHLVSSAGFSGSLQIGMAINITLQDMQIENSATLDSNPCPIRTNDFAWDIHIINGFYIQSSVTGTPGQPRTFNDQSFSAAGCILHMRNVVMVALGGSATGTITAGASPTVLLYNCTFVCSGATASALVAQWAGAGSYRIKNLLLQGGGTTYLNNGTTPTQIVSILTNDTTSPTTALRSKVCTFVNTSGRDYHSAGGDPSIGAGTDLSTDAFMPFTTDCDGNPR